MLRNNQKGFASMCLVYSFFLIFILMMMTTLMVNNYKRNFLNILKNDVKDELKNYHIPIVIENIENE